MRSSGSTSTAIEPLDLGGVQLLDHHAHPLSRDQHSFTLDAFRMRFSESRDARNAAFLSETLVYRRAVRDLAALLGCDADEQAVWDARRALPFAELARRCFDACNMSRLLLDTGFGGAGNLGLPEMEQLAGVPVAHLLRLETLIEQLVEQTGSLSQLEDALRARVRDARSGGTVGLKSIAAYRGGLLVEPRSADEAGRALAELQEARSAGGSGRLTQRPLLEYLLLAALEEAAAIELPVQFHVALGDDDADLRLANPLQLRPIVSDARFHRAPIVLLHCYPYVREAGYLAHLYANVFVDVSLAVPLTGAGTAARFAEALELAPSSKVLFATDAHGIPELFYVAALHGRRALGRCLAEHVAQEYLTPREAQLVAEQILWRNAASVYGTLHE